MIVFTVNEEENTCIAGLNRQAGYATDSHRYSLRIFGCVLQRILQRSEKVACRDINLTLQRTTKNQSLSLAGFEFASSGF